MGLNIHTTLAPFMYGIGSPVGFGKPSNRLPVPFHKT
jgi:hypothetical protein